MFDLGKPLLALRYTDEALYLPASNIRTAALHTALTATAQAAAGCIDEAVDLGSAAAAKARRIRSRRVQTRLDALAKLLQPYRKVQGVAPLLEEIQAERPQQNATT